MPLSYCFDFGDKYTQAGPWSIAFRVFTETNAFTPDPNKLSVTRDGDQLKITSDGFAWGGLQQRCAGSFEATVTIEGNAATIDIKATINDRIKGTTVLLRGIEGGESSNRDFGFTPLGLGKSDMYYYPGGLRVPAWMIQHADGTYTATASLDEEVRGKTFAAVPEDDQWLLELHHHEDARKWSTRHTTPTWRIEKTSDPTSLLERRCQIMENKWGIGRWDTRSDVPDWTRKIGLVLNLHGVHWTGFVFNDYAQQLKIIEHICEQLDGRHVLAYLPAWDGRYNYNWPYYYASEQMGGEAGLKKLIQGAHALGVHLIPQLGAVSSNRQFTPTGLQDAIGHDSYGNHYVKPVEWDGDRQPDTYRVNANVGHPGFRQFLVDCSSRLINDFEFDGMFFDINMGFYNDPRFHVTEGHVQLANAIHEEFDDKLIFGENWYDGLLGPYPINHSVNGQGQGYLHNWTDLFDRYMRTTYHLIHPAPGKGSTGVYEAGFLEPYVPDPDVNVIPAISFVEDTMTNHLDAVNEHIDIAKSYIKRMGI